MLSATEPAYQRAKAFVDTIDVPDIDDYLRKLREAISAMKAPV